MTSKVKPAKKVVGVRDVARLAGCSVGTVSNVINRPDQVRPDSRARVEKAIEELQYVGSRVAGQLRSGRSLLVGVVVPDVGNPFWANVLRGIEEVLDDHRLVPVVTSSRLDAVRERSILRVLESQQVDGLLVAPVTASAKLMEPFRDRRLGVVTLDYEMSGGSFSSVSLDDIKGGELAAVHLIESGHRRFALVNSSGSWSGDRRAGVVRALLAHNLKPDECLREVTIQEETIVAGRAAAKTIAEMRARPTAIICGNDLLALGVLLELQERHLRVPDDFALVGYDDVEFAAALSPPLSSVRQPPYEMGKAAARLLVEHRRGRARHIRFAPELVARASSGTVFVRRR